MRNAVHKQMWGSSDVTTYNQNGHVLIEHRHISALMNVKTFIGSISTRIITTPRIPSDNLVRVYTEAINNKTLRHTYKKEINATMTPVSRFPGDEESTSSTLNLN